MINAVIVIANRDLCVPGQILDTEIPLLQIIRAGAAHSSFITVGVFKGQYHLFTPFDVPHLIAGCINAQPIYMDMWILLLIRPTRYDLTAIIIVPQTYKPKIMSKVKYIIIGRTGG